MPISLALVRKLDGVDARLKEVLYSILEEVELNREESVTKKEFKELTIVVNDLGQATKELTIVVNDLGQATKELAEAQKRTEHKLETLTERVDSLAKAQNKTEEELQSLGNATKDLQKQVGGISMAVGYGIEDKAYPALPALLKRDFELNVEGRLKRGYVRDKKGHDLEVNIIGKAKSEDGKTIMIIGEGKSQLSKNDVNDFIRRRLNRLQGIFSEIFPVIVTYMISEADTEDYARQKGIALYYSYDF